MRRRDNDSKVRGEIATEHSLSILVVGEGHAFGDIPAFEYARNLAAAQPDWRVIGSRLGGAPHGAGQETLPGIAGLPNLHLLDNVDATRLVEGAITGGETYDRIVFHNSHVEEGGALARARATGGLIDGFVWSARALLTPEGFARVTINPQFVRQFTAVSGAIARAGGQLMGRFGDDPELYAPFHAAAHAGRTHTAPGRRARGDRPGSVQF